MDSTQTRRKKQINQHKTSRKHGWSMKKLIFNDKTRIYHIAFGDLQKKSERQSLTPMLTKPNTGPSGALCWRCRLEETNKFKTISIDLFSKIIWIKFVL
jgi:hypothetical protein